MRVDPLNNGPILQTSLFFVALFDFLYEPLCRGRGNVYFGGWLLEDRKEGGKAGR